MVDCVRVPLFEFEEILLLLLFYAASSQQTLSLVQQFCTVDADWGVVSISRPFGPETLFRTAARNTNKPHHLSVPTFFTPCFYLFSAERIPIPSKTIDKFRFIVEDVRVKRVVFFFHEMLFITDSQHLRKITPSSPIFIPYSSSMVQGSRHRRSLARPSIGGGGGDVADNNQTTEHTQHDQQQQLQQHDDYQETPVGRTGRPQRRAAVQSRVNVSLLFGKSSPSSAAGQQREHPQQQQQQQKTQRNRRRVSRTRTSQEYMTVHQDNIANNDELVCWSLFRILYKFHHHIIII